MNQAKTLLSRCGFRCDLCLAYQPNIEVNPANRHLLVYGWGKYFGINIQPEEISCPGCLSDGPTMDSNCPVRPCARSRGFATCAQCGDYICQHLAERIVTCSEIQQKTGEDIPLEDYLLFIRPYENGPRLEALRSAGGEKPL
jgi:hypothetical protein